MEGFQFELDCPRLKIFGFGGRYLPNGTFTDLKQNVVSAHNIPESCQGLFMNDNYSNREMKVPFHLILNGNRHQLVDQIQGRFPAPIRPQAQFPRNAWNLAQEDNNDMDDDSDDERMDDQLWVPIAMRGPLGDLAMRGRRAEQIRREREYLRLRRRDARRQLGGLRPGEHGPLPRPMGEGRGDALARRRQHREYHRRQRDLISRQVQRGVPPVEDAPTVIRVAPPPPALQETRPTIRNNDGDEDRPAPAAERTSERRGVLDAGRDFLAAIPAIWGSSEDERRRSDPLATMNDLDRALEGNSLLLGQHPLTLQAPMPLSTEQEAFFLPPDWN